MQSFRQELARLMNRPDAFLLIKEAMELLKGENLLKQAFIQDWLAEEDVYEFINGKSTELPPIKGDQVRRMNKLVQYINNYSERKNVGLIFSQKKRGLIQLSRNIYEPLVSFFSSTKAKHLSPDSIVYPAPDFILEVVTSPTQWENIDLKKIAFAAHQTPEFWIIDDQNKKVEQYLLSKQKYELHQQFVAQGRLESIAIEGFSFLVERFFK